LGSIRRQNNQAQRSDIAHVAARLVARGEARNFSGAIRKAAASLGLKNFRNAPQNMEVHNALLLYLQHFEGDRWAQRIAAMRHEARAAMIVLAQFRPCLVGPVLYGSACEHSPVTLHLYTDETESVTRFLHETKINYSITHTVLEVSRSRREEFPTYLVVVNEFEFDLVVLSEVYNSHPPLSSLNGRPFRRANIDALDTLISEAATEVKTDDSFTDYGGF
tara:strand:- start:947 stop:1606 length:660 start_codon:yes stop_codon:yes gene_type:complete